MPMIASPLAFIDGLGTPEMMLIFVIVLMLFGGQKLPEFARGLGKSIREFKKAATGVEEEFRRALDEDELRHATPVTSTPPSTASAHPGPEDPDDPNHEYTEDEHSEDARSSTGSADDSHDDEHADEPAGADPGTRSEEAATDAGGPAAPSPDATIPEPTPPEATESATGTSTPEIKPRTEDETERHT